MGQKLQMPTGIQTFDYDSLKSRGTPARGGGQVAEANIDVLYDTQTAAAAGLAQLNFFTTVNADQTLSNMELAGSLPADTYFDVWRIFIDANRLPTATNIVGAGVGPTPTAAGVLNDIATILHTGRGTFTFTMFNKPVGPIPLTFFGSSGSVEGQMALALAGAYTAANSQQVHQQFARMPDNGGWPANGTFRIPPQVKFGCQLNFAGGVTLTTDTPLKIVLLGVKYRRNA